MGPLKILSCHTKSQHLILGIILYNLYLFYIIFIYIAPLKTKLQSALQSDSSVYDQLKN